MKLDAHYIRLGLCCAAATSLVACGALTPRPEVERGWEKGAGSAAEAEPAPEVRSAREGALAANAVLAGARRTSEEKKRGEATGAPMVSVAEIEPAAALGEAPAATASTEATVKWLVTAAEFGKSSAWMQRKLDADKPDRVGETRFFWQGGDFDADGRKDLAVTFFADCLADGCPKAGHWTAGVIWGEGGWSELAESQQQSPTFYGPADLTGDKRPDLVLAIEECGAHTCFEQARIYSTHGVEPFRKVFDSKTAAADDGPGWFAQSLEIVDTEGAGPARLRASGGLVGSAGAGPFQREYHDIWAWDDRRRAFERVRRDWAESNLRLHRLHDAIVLLEAGNREHATVTLEQMIENDALLELPADMKPDPAMAETLRKQLDRTALFLLARLALQRGDREAYQSILDGLRAQAPESPATRATAALGEAWDKDSPASGCRTAAALFPSEADDDWLLDSYQLGYNAPVAFGPAAKTDLCAGLENPDQRD